MEIQSLQQTPLTSIVACLVEAFRDYFVPMPDSVDFWRTRFAGARVDWRLSFGVFDEHRLVGFITNGLDQLDGELTAFNTGTGVLEAYRGQRWVDQLYEFALPRLLDSGVRRCQLEVIEQNARAIRVYERIGFRKTRRLCCFGGSLNDWPTANVQLQPSDLASVSTPDACYSWDHTRRALEPQLGETYTCYRVYQTDGTYLGYFVIRADHTYLAQLEAVEGSYAEVLSGVRQLTDRVRINNVEERLGAKRTALERAGLINTINQLEMEWGIGRALS